MINRLLQHSIWLSLLIASFPETGGLSIQKPVDGQTARSDAIKINTTFVTVPVTVKDADGRFITGLSKEDFLVFEDDNRQEISNFSYTEAPINIAVLLDTSPSTKEWLGTLRKYVLAFTGQLRSEDHVSLVTFNERVHFHGEFTSNRKAIARQISTVESGIATAFYDAISLTITRKFASVKGRKALIIFTDGRDSWSHQATAESTMELVRNAGIPCYVIQYWTDVISARYLNALADSSGGLRIPVESIRNADAAFAIISDELSHQYTLGYYSTNEQSDDKYRKISVQVKRKNVTLRASQGYRIAKS